MKSSEKLARVKHGTIFLVHFTNFWTNFKTPTNPSDK